MVEIAAETAAPAVEEFGGGEERKLRTVRREIVGASISFYSSPPPHTSQITPVTCYIQTVTQLDDVF